MENGEKEQFFLASDVFEHSISINVLFNYYSDVEKKGFIFSLPPKRLFLNNYFEPASFFDIFQRLW